MCEDFDNLKAAVACTLITFALCAFVVIKHYATYDESSISNAGVVTQSQSVSVTQPQSVDINLNISVDSSMDE